MSGREEVSKGLLPWSTREAVFVGMWVMWGGNAKVRLQNLATVWMQAASEPWVLGPAADWILQWQMQRWGLGPAWIEGRGA